MSSRGRRLKNLIYAAALFSMAPAYSYSYNLAGFWNVRPPLAPQALRFTSYRTRLPGNVTALCSRSNEALVYSSANELFGASYSDSVWLSSTGNNGATFESSFLGQRSPIGPCVSLGSDIYAIQSGSLLLSHDGGSSFAWQNPSNWNSPSRMVVDGSNIYTSSEWQGFAVSTDQAASFTTLFAGPRFKDLYLDGHSLYLSSLGSGIYVSTDGGASFQNRGSADGMPTDSFGVIAASGPDIYMAGVSSAAGGDLGLVYSLDGGASFGMLTQIDGLPSLAIRALQPAGNRLYVGTDRGLAIVDLASATVQGVRTRSNGLVSNDITSLMFRNSALYVGTSSGLSVSTDYASTFTASSWGLPSGNPQRVFANGSNVVLQTDRGIFASQNLGASFTPVPGIPFELYQSYFQSMAGTQNEVWVSDFSWSLTQGLWHAPFSDLVFTHRDLSPAPPVGFGDDHAFGIAIDGSNFYVNTYGGLGVSRDLGATFSLKTTLDGLAASGTFSIAASGTNVYASDSYGTLDVSHDAGESFTQVLPKRISNVAGVGVYGGKILAAAQFGGLSASVDGGVTYSKIINDQIYNITIQGSHIYAGGWYNVYYSHNGGATYNSYNTWIWGPNIVGGDGNFIYVKDGSSLRISTNAGSSFTTVPTGFNFSSLYASGSDVYLGASDGLHISHNAGVTFGSASGPSGLTFITGTGSTLYATNGGNLYRSTDSGAHFTNLNVSGCHAVAIFNTNVYASCGSQIAVSTNGGASFSTITPTGLPTGGAADGIAADANGIYVIAGTSKYIYVSTDGGNTFTNPMTTNALPGTSISALYTDSDYLLVGGDAGLSISRDGGQSFSVKTQVDGLGGDYTIGVTRYDNKIFALNYGGLNVSSDGGSSFQIVNGVQNCAYMYPEGANFWALCQGGLFLGDGTNFTPTYGLSSLSNATDIAFDGSYVYVGTSSSGLMVSSDGGQSFTHKGTLEGLADSSVNLLLMSGSTLYVGTANGLSYTSDHGATFVSKGQADGLPLDYYGKAGVRGIAASGDNVYIGVLGGLAVSTDGGTHIALRTQANSGLTADDTYGVYLDGTTLYVATASGLARSTDGANSFSTLTNSIWYGRDVYARGSDIYFAASFYGFYISNDGGTNFRYSNGASSVAVAVDRGKVYLGSDTGGLVYSTNGGRSYYTHTTANGLPSTNIRRVRIHDGVVYVITDMGISISR